MKENEEFEVLKKAYIHKTVVHLKALETLGYEDVKDPNIKAEVALRQVESSTSFMDLCKFIMNL